MRRSGLSARRGALGPGLAALLTIAAATATAGDWRGFMLASACLNCHGDGAPDGRGIPAIAGRPAGELARALREYRDGRRGATVMDRLARGYDDAEIEAMARWIAALPAPAP